MSKKSKQGLPRLRQLKERRAFTELMLGLDKLFREAFEYDRHIGKFEARYILELRPVFQTVIANHIKGKTSTAHGIAKDIGIPRTTVLRILDDLILLDWVERSGSQYWISEYTARLPTMKRAAYRKAVELVIDTAKELQSKSKK